MKEKLSFARTNFGTDVIDRKKINGNDLLIVAHIWPDGSKISYYEKLSYNACIEIEKFALQIHAKTHKDHFVVLIKKHYIKTNETVFEVDLWTSEMIDKKYQNTDLNYTRQFVQLFQPISKYVNGISVKLYDCKDSEDWKFAVDCIETKLYRTFSTALMHYNSITPNRL